MWILPFMSFLIGYSFLHYLFQVNYVEIPLLVGKTVDQVVPLLTELNLNMRLLHYKEGVDVPAGTILSQIPAASQRVKPHQSIFLVIAKQSHISCAPDVRNQTVEVIKNQLETRGIVPQMYYVPTIYPASHCVAQIPTGGEVLKDNKMILYLSDTSTEKIIWPNFISKRVEDVVEFLQVQGISAEIIHTYAATPGHFCSDCLVVDQRPLPGAIITFNTPVHPLRVQLQVE